MQKFFEKENSEGSTAGFMMIEALVAVSIIAVSVLSAMAVAQKSAQIARQSLHTAQAAFLLEEGAEAVRIVRDNGWANISALSAGTAYYPTFSSAWTLSTTPHTIGIFTRTVSIDDVGRDASGDISDGSTVDMGTKRVTVTVSWAEGGTSMSKSIQFYIMDIFS